MDFPSQRRVVNYQPPVCSVGSVTKYVKYNKTKEKKVWVKDTDFSCKQYLGIFANIHSKKSLFLCFPYERIIYCLWSYLSFSCKENEFVFFNCRSKICDFHNSSLKVNLVFDVRILNKLLISNSYTSLQPDVVDLWYFKLWILLDQII